MKLKLIEFNDGTRTELTQGTLQEIVEYLKANPDVYGWHNDYELDTQALLGKDRYRARLVELELDNIVTVKELERELNKLNFGWWWLSLAMKEVINLSGARIDFETSAQFMDDEIREELHNELAPCSEQEFFTAYEKAHEEKFGEEWELSKINPVY